MPLNGNTYVAPVWRNGQPPALDPTELQAISDTLAAAQSKNTDQDSLIAALQTAVGGKAQIEIGSYVGTGTYGADNPNSITCSFAPKFVIIYLVTDNFYINTRSGTFNNAAIWGSPQPRICTQWNGNLCYVDISLVSTTLSWVTTYPGGGGVSESQQKYWGSQSQLNIQGELYNYIAVA